MFWLMVAVLGVVAVLVGLVLEFRGGRLGTVVGQYCSVVGGFSFVAGAVGVILSIVSLFVHFQ